LAVVDPAGPWRQIALLIPRLLSSSSRHGFAMDWVNYDPGDGFYPTPAPPGKDPEGPTGSYDAIRVYLWAGMLNRDSQMRAEVLNAVPGMGAYLVNHDAPPEKISDQGIPGPQDGPVGFSAAVLPYLKSSPGFEKSGKVQTARLDRLKNASTGLFGKDATYYDQNLALFATGFLEGRFRFGPGGELIVDWTH
jgi:endoglucanase